MSALRIPPRTGALKTRLAFAAVQEAPGFARYRPFNDEREILLRRGGGAREIRLDPPFVSAMGPARIGPFVVEVVRMQQVLSPPVMEPGRPPTNPEDYRPVDDILLLPDGELLIRRSPRGFSDMEVSRILAGIEIDSNLPPGASTDSFRDYLPAMHPTGGGAPLMGGPPMGGPPAGGPPMGGPGPVGGPPGQLTGREVTLEAMSFSTPTRCCACLAPKETTLKVSGSRAGFGHTKVRSFESPYCRACAARVKSTRVKNGLLALAAIGVALVVSLLTFAAPGLPAVVLIGFPIAATLAFGFAAMTVLRPAAPPPPAIGAGDAVRVVTFKSGRSVLYCANPQWGEEFARANNARFVAKSRSDKFGGGALFFACIAGPFAGGGFWSLTHPDLYIDNAGAEAIQIWVDGKPALVAQPNEGATTPHLDIPFGHHALGYSAVGASAPEGAIDVATPMSRAFLYNPGKTACYWAEAAFYGKASTDGLPDGALPIEEFYTFKKVDNWFKENPKSISTKSSGETRVSINRDMDCMKLASDGCDLADRVAFMNCEAAAKSNEDIETCVNEANCAHHGPAGANEEDEPSAPSHAQGNVQEYHHFSTTPPTPAPHVPPHASASPRASSVPHSPPAHASAATVAPAVPTAKHP
jgi:hypothetical protein